MTTIKKNSTEAWLDELDLTREDMRDGSHLARIGAALEAVETAQEQLRRAVADAHAAGDSWAAIGLVLGTSRQAAHRKYAPLIAQRTGYTIGRKVADGAVIVRKVQRNSFGQTLPKDAAGRKAQHDRGW